MLIPKLFGTTRRVAANDERTANPEKVQEEDETTLHQSDRARKTRSRYTPTTAAPTIPPSTTSSAMLVSHWRVALWFFSSNDWPFGKRLSVDRRTSLAGRSGNSFPGYE